MIWVWVRSWVRLGWLAKNTSLVTSHPVFALDQKNRVWYFSSRVRKFWLILPDLKLIFMALISMSSHYMWAHWRISITILKFKQVETSLIDSHLLDLKFQLWKNLNFYNPHPFFFFIYLFYRVSIYGVHSLW